MCHSGWSERERIKNCSHRSRVRVCLVAIRTIVRHIQLARGFAWRASSCSFHLNIDGEFANPKRHPSNGCRRHWMFRWKTAIPLPPRQSPLHFTP
jgi:hypothetical protein